MNDNRTLFKDLTLNWGSASYPLFKSGDFTVENIENLTWGNSELATATNPFIEGDIIQNKRPMARDVTITLKPTENIGDYSNLIHKFARLFNKPVNLTYKRTIPSFIDDINDFNKMELTLSGVVNEFETPRFDGKTRIVLNVHCENPFWQGEAITKNTLATSEYFCTYSESDAGFSLEIPNLDLLTQSDYYLVQLRLVDNSYIASLYINAFWRGLGSGISAPYSYFGFEKNKIQVLAGNTKATAIDVSSKVNWRYYSYFDGHGLLKSNEFPRLPTINEKMALTIHRYDGTSLEPVTGSLTWRPQFL